MTREVVPFGAPHEATRWIQRTRLAPDVTAPTADDPSDAPTQPALVAPTRHKGAPLPGQLRFDLPR